MKPVKMFDYLDQYHQIKPSIDSAIQRVIESGVLILGPELDSLETEFTRFLGCAGHSTGVANGTDALTISLMAIGVGPGDEVITTPNTAVATVSAIRNTGAAVVFCDVDPDTGLMDIGLLDGCFSSKTRAVVPVHLYGNAVDVRKVRDQLGQREIFIVEDCAQALGSEIDGHKCGTLGDVAAFSFYPTKNLGAFGDAGMCFTRDRALSDRIRSIRTYGFDEKQVAKIEGVNSRLDEMQAAILRAKLPFLERFIEARRNLAKAYTIQLEGHVELTPAGRDVYHSYHLFVVKVSDRGRIRRRLRARQIQTAVHYPEPIHLMPAYAFMNHRENSFPVCESLARKILSLPLYPELPEDNVDRVCEGLKFALEESTDR